MTWPHQVQLGNGCVVEQLTYFKFDGIWSEGPSIVISDHVFIGANCEFNIRSGISIGKHSLIASGSRFVDHDHGTDRSMWMRTQPGPESSITIGEDVWIGCNCVVLKGVTIARGAIAGAGAVVTKSIPEYEIWAGVPARKISERAVAS